MQSDGHLTIFVLHASELLTDHNPHGDGIAAYGFVAGLANTGHKVHLATSRWPALRGSLPERVFVHKIDLKLKNRYVSRFEYAVRVRLLYRSLQRHTHFDIVQQMVPVKKGMSIGMLGVEVPLVLGTYVGQWPPSSTSLEPKSAPLSRKIADFVAQLIMFVQMTCAAAILVTTPAATASLPFRGLFKRRIFEVHHGIDPITFSTTVGNSEARKKTVLFLGNVEVRKGIFTLLEAFPSVVQRVPDARLMIAGSGNDFEAVRARVAELPCAPSVEMLGPIDRARVPDIMRSAAIYCAPAYGEPYSTSLLEAMACGCAIVVSNSGGAPFMVPDAGGLRVVQRDGPALADALVELLLDHGAAVRMGLENQNAVTEKYSHDAVIRSLVAVYRKVIERHAIR